ncbi:unnamed protein product, partial [Gongylonema pulchrum]|uniref:DUF1919 domain-containing protein n=1 Tax=Gongylonema pulchrum TaxID=637853 RepID=A0A183EVV6_9BILA
MPLRYRPVLSSVGCKSVEGSYSWFSYLETMLFDMKSNGYSDFDCEKYAVPVKRFHQAPFAEYMRYLDNNFEVEVALMSDYDYDILPLKLYWFARVVKVAGYRLLLRYEGMDRESDDTFDFWVSIGSRDFKPLG